MNLLKNNSLPGKLQSLEEREGRFRALIIASADMVYSMNPDWTIMTELVGRGFLLDTREPIVNWMDIYIPADEQDRVKAAIRHAIDEKKIFHLEHKVQLANGATGWTLSRAVPIFDPEGGIVEWFGAASDITERRRIDEALREAKEIAEQQKRLYETITSSTPDLIYVFDLDYRFTYANQALLAMWGKTWKEAIGKRLIDNGYEDWHAEMHEREIDEIKTSKKTIRGEVAFPHAVLGRRVYDYILTPVFNEDGEVEAVAGTTRDITEIKENEQRKNDFISMVSHELKTPLTSAIGYVQLSQNKAQKEKDTIGDNLLTRAGRQLSKMTSLINSFLNVSRLESGKLKMDKHPFDMHLLLKEIEEEARISFESHHLVFNTGAPAAVEADRDKIGQVIQNLLSNAAKYAPAGSAIKISCDRVDGQVLVSIADEGPGIREEDATRIFERFYRVENEQNKGVSGFGIGLYLCSEIIQGHGGTIGVKSKPGEGSYFYFTLPVR